MCLSGSCEGPSSSIWLLDELSDYQLVNKYAMAVSNSTLVIKQLWRLRPSGVWWRHWMVNSYRRLIGSCALLSRGQAIQENFKTNLFRINAASFSATSVTVYQVIRCHVTEGTSAHFWQTQISTKFVRYVRWLQKRLKLVQRRLVLSGLYQIDS
jgi:hypothetical protein